ncbi:carboxypeptidase regulatory-like domain-containing protein [Vulgatibacter incomptus]|uniref:PDZ domain-containing protein n=1 Tax=Vulgatibacter incomptus TaxID=1391653 RepID=A0A0K1PFM5_9BACT|nr:carboxypeptidase regulatory-like domain-containing protein [Vulgatibacter incomptus]AKU91919.1 hypothetical protein AKJ08_2306 [Vulgatibacter incomptus]
MRLRRLVIAASLALAAVAVMLLLREPSTPPEPAASSGSGSGHTEAQQEPTPFARRGPQRLGGGHLGGQVQTQDARPAGGAEIRAIRSEGGAAAAVASAAADGSFRLGPLPPGDYHLVARQGPLSSEPLGPIPLAEGEELGGLVLRLQRGGSVFGVVRDASTGDALEGATLQAAGVSVRTDRVGAFRLEGLPPAEVELTASADGYEARSLPLSLDAGPVGGLELLLSRGARIRGRVVDSAGAPVGGATLLPIPYRLDSVAGHPAVTSRPDGSFDVGAPVGVVTVKAIDTKGDTGYSDAIELAPGTTREGIVIRIGESGRIAGNVNDAAGAVVVGARVHAVDRGRTIAEAVTGSDGRFALERIPAGFVQLVAARGAARGLVGPLELLEGEAAEVTIQLGGAVLQGRAVDAAGRPVPGAELAVWPEAGPPSLASHTSAGADGFFELRGVPGGPLRLEATAEELAGGLRGIFANEGDVTVTLSGGALSGLVLRQGRPASDFVVAASPLEPGRGRATSQAILSPDGRFRLRLPAGAYEVRASARGTGVATARAVVPDRGDSPQVVLELEEGGVIEGVVLDAKDGSPLAGARVSLSRSGTFAFGQAADVPKAPQTLTGGDGSFRLSGVAPGRMPVFAYASGHGFVPPAIVDVREGSPSRVEIRLPPRGDGPGEEVFGGIGLTIGLDRGQVVAAEVVGGGPAFVAGMRRGDVILAVDGMALGGALQLAVDRIRGPVGTPVTLEMQREGVGFRLVAVRSELRY